MSVFTKPATRRERLAGYALAAVALPFAFAMVTGAVVVTVWAYRAVFG